MIYVRKADSDTWHWASNCTQLPHRIARTLDVEGRRTVRVPERPPSGELCNQCLSKERRKVLVPFDAAPSTTEEA